jgi:NADPH:quinone reductase-like Zn-dependent oxidoreductase
MLAFLLLIPATSFAAADSCEPLPETTQAIRMHGYGGPEQLRLDTIPTPTAGAGEVLIRVHSASVNPIDWKLREGAGKDWWPLQLPTIIGRDGSGTIVGVGAGVGGFHCGDAVVVLAASDRGTSAEYIVANAADVAPKPASMNFQEAAAYPLVGITAWNGVVETGGLKKGERVLIHGGAGGVGSMAVQIAKARGAYVIATASARNHAFLKELGADEVVDYQTQRFEEVVKDVDLVFDTVGGDTLKRSPKVLVPGGRLVSIVGGLSSQTCTDAGIVCPAEKDSAPKTGFAELQKLIDRDALKVHVDAEYPLSDVGIAQERNREGHTRGKIVIRVSE